MGPPPSTLTPETYSGPEKTLPRRVFGVLVAGGVPNSTGRGPCWLRPSPLEHATVPKEEALITMHKEANAR